MSASPPLFVWRRELPWMLVPIAACLLVRLAVLPFLLAYFHSDTAIGGLMAKHIWDGSALPAYYYGQRYVGSLEMFAAAPFYGWLGPDPRGIALAHTLLFSAGMVVFYRLYYKLGGRVAALVGSVVLAIGTPWVVMLTTGRQYSYMSTLVLGALVYLVGHPFVERPTPRRAVAFGALLGLAWWNNPQIAHFLAPLLLAAWASGRVCALRREGRLAAGFAAPQVARGFLIAIALAALAVVGTVALALHGPINADWLSLSKPAKYVVRACAALIGLLFLTEVAVARGAGELRRWALILGLLAVGFAAGHAPAIAAKATRSASGMKAPIGIDPSHVARTFPKLLEQGGDMLLGEASHGRDDPGALGAALRTLRWIVIGLGACVLLGVPLARRDELAGLLTARGGRLSIETVLWLQAAVVCTLYLTAPVEHPTTRYLLPLWVPAAGLVAWGASRVWDRHEAVGVTFVVVVVAYLAVCQGVWRSGWLPRQQPRALHALIESLEARQATLGYGDYFMAYRVSYLTDEKIRVACRPALHDRVPTHRTVVEAAERPFAVYDLTQPDQVAEHAVFVRAHSGHVVESWVVADRYRVVLFRRPRP